MSAPPAIHPAHLQGSFVVAQQGAGTKTVSFQYNPETMRRQLTAQLRGGQTDEHSDELHYLGAPTQTITIEVIIDATAALDADDPTALEFGIHPQLAVLETLLYPSSSLVTQTQSKLQGGVLEVSPFEVPTLTFVWGPNRSLPVQIASMTVNEELFDTNLNPIRASLEMSLRVITWSDVAVNNANNRAFLAYQRHLEILAGKVK